jgi:hypothetical protein
MADLQQQIKAVESLLVANVIIDATTDVTTIDPTGEQVG